MIPDYKVLMKNNSLMMTECKVEEMMTVEIHVAPLVCNFGDSSAG